MKKLMLLWLLVVGSTLTALAHQNISVSATQGHPGDEVTLTVALDNTEAVTAAEIVLPLAPSLRYVEGSATLAASRVQDHVLSASVINDQLRLYIYSLGLKPFLGNSGALLNIKLKLGTKPEVYPLQPEVILSDAQGKAVPTDVSPGQVTLLAPELTIDNPTIDFGHEPIRFDYTQSLILRNSGTEPLTIDKITTAAQEIAIGSWSQRIAPGATEYVTLTYSPQQRGDWKSAITVTSNASNGPQTATLVAQPFSKNELHVDRVEGKANEVVDVVLRVNNQEPIVGMQCEIELPEQLLFIENSFHTAARTAQHQGNATLVGNKLTLFLYSPSNAAMTGEEGEIGRFQVRLNGHWSSRIEPKNVILSNKEAENMTSDVFGNDVYIQSPDFYGKSTLDMGKGAVTKPLVAHYNIQNNGSIPLTIDKVNFLAEGFKVNTPLPLSIEPWTSGSLEIAYEGKQEGKFSTTMNLYTNDPELPLQAVALSGSLYEPNGLNFSGDNFENGDYQWTVGLDNYTDIVALQMDLHWQPGTKTNIDQLVKSARLKDHQVSVAKIGAQDYRVIIFSMSNQVIPGKDGALFTLRYQAEGGTIIKDTQLHVDNILLSNAEGKNYASATTINATAAYNHFTIRFMAGEQTVSTAFLKVGDAIVSPQAPEKEGYTFVRWESVPATMPAKDVTSQAVYQPNKYDIIYKVDGKEVHRDTYDFGAQVTAYEMPNKEGHTFSGWEGMVEKMPAKDVIVTGSYAINSYEVIFRIGEQEIYHENLPYGSAIMVPKVPEKEGHTFTGWGKIDATVPAHDVTYEGSYTINIYKVIYYVGDKVYKIQEVAYGDKFTLIDYVPEDPRYTFTEWVGERYETMPAHDVTYHAAIMDGIVGLPIDSRMDVYHLSGVKLMEKVTIEQLKQQLPTGIYIIGGKKVMWKK